jgi:hypothetical protein
LLGANGNLAAVLEDISNHSASIYVKFGQKEPDPYRTAADVAEATPAIELLVEPYLVKGAVTAAA